MSRPVAGKGDDTRPKFITDEEWDDNHDSIDWPSKRKDKNEPKMRQKKKLRGEPKGRNDS